VLPYAVMFVVSLLLANAAAQGGAGASAQWTHDRALQGLVVLGAVIAANVLSVPIRYLVCRWVFTDFALRVRTTSAGGPATPAPEATRGNDHC